MEREMAFDPAKSVANRLGDREFEALLHFSRSHPATFDQESQGHLHITLSQFANSLSARGIKFIDQAKHAENVRLRHAILVQPHDLAFAQANREYLRARRYKQLASFLTQGEHF